MQGSKHLCYINIHINRKNIHCTLYSSFFDYEEKTSNKSRSTLAPQMDDYHVDNNDSALYCRK